MKRKDKERIRSRARFLKEKGLGRRRAARSKRQKLLPRSLESLAEDLREYYIARAKRREFLKKHYRRRTYTEKPIYHPVSGQLGIEESGLVEKYLATASSIIECKASRYNFDFSTCERIWPSAVMLYCSLVQWVDLTSLKRRPHMASQAPRNSKVSSYLEHCGFYSWVKNSDVSGAEVDKGNFDERAIVKIRRETKNDLMGQREDEIMELLNNYSTLDDDGKELFCNKVLLEVTRNVQEHGVTSRDNGWWLLAQYHPTHGIISLCIADNGIGFRRSLTTGPQAEEIRQELDNKRENDDKFIRMAIEKVVSGASDASQKEKKVFRESKYARGSHRGYGLKRIAHTCKTLGISFSILSDCGAVFVDNGGNFSLCRSMSSRVFAGTMYNFVISAKKVEVKK